MNSYTDKEIEDLLKNITWWGPPNQNMRSYRLQDPVSMYKHSAPMRDGIIGNVTTSKDTYEAITMEQLHAALTGTLSRFDKHPALQFIVYTPLEDVPLYVNTYPDVAAWRLRIAK